MKGTDIIADSLRIIGTNADGEGPEPWQSLQHAQRLNELLSEWYARGIELGWQPLVNPTDVAYLPDWAVRGVKYNLAVAIAPEYQKEASADLKRLARESYDLICKMTVDPTFVDTGDIPQGRRNYFFNVNTGQ